MDSRAKHRDFRTLAMSVHPHQTTRGSSNQPSSSEVSLSFEDELAATIHGAFEVAVEIAVLEVSKLVGQALRDVRDQMHETLRENKSLKERLLGAEQELDVLRGSSVEGIAVQAVEPRLKNPLKSTRGSGKTAAPECDGIVVVDTDSNDGCFSEIREDGRVCSQHRTEGGQCKLAPSTDHPHLPASKVNCLNQYTKNHLVTMKFEQQCSEVVTEDGSLRSDVKQVNVKEENSETASRSDPSGDAAEDTGDDFGADSLSLAQSRLLEDWRPEPLEDCETDSFTPCASHSLSDPSVFSSVTANSDGLVPTAGGLPLFAPPFSNPFQSGAAELVSTSQQPYHLHVSSSSSVISSTPRMHVCKDCGVAFQQLGELRRHSQQHTKALPRSAKRATLPSGHSPYHCSHCGRNFNRLENLKTHLRIHTGERPYTCSVCGVRFRHSGALTRHFRIHTGEKPYACSQCGKTFRNCGGLRFHQRSHVREGQSVAD